MKNPINIILISTMTMIGLSLPGGFVMAQSSLFCETKSLQVISSPVNLEETGPRATVFVNLGDNIQHLVEKHSGGTTFIIAAGTHRFQNIRPKSNNSFVGEKGAILSGAIVLTNFRKEGAHWVAHNQRQQGFVKGGCEKDLGNLPSGGCKFPEDLFFDHNPLLQVTSLTDLGSGLWYFDYAKDRIYLADDPTGHHVETSVTRHAFEGNAKNVTIQGLVIEKYSNPTQEGAIHPLEGDREGGLGENWRVRNNEIRLNHGFGIRTGHQMLISHNHIHHNGQLGIGGSGNGILVENTEIAHNNTQGYNFRNEAGGLKLVRTDGVILRSNYVHHNVGPGLWLDVDNVNIIYEGNRLFANRGMGIFHEKGYEAVIRNNIAEENGFGFPTWLMGGGIVVSASSNVEIHGNTVRNNADGIGVVQGTDKSGSRGPFVTENVFVHDNRIVMTDGESGLAVKAQDTSFFTGRNNRFERNSYVLIGPKKQFFRWLNALQTEEDWRNAGLDTGGSFSRIP